MLRIVALSLATVCAQNDETSLMQGLKPTQASGTADKTKAITNLLSTATTMLKNGATPDVVEFAKATLKDIKEIVLPAIESAHATDQKLIDDTFRMFEAALKGLQDANEKVELASDEERRLSALYNKCRTEEEGVCGEKRECDYDLYQKWLDFEEQEQDLRDEEKKISGHFCVEDANGTASIFRQNAVVLFPPIITLYPVVTGKEKLYDIKIGHCEKSFKKLDEKTAACDALQLQLEQAACSLAIEVQKTRTFFAQAWYFAHAQYQRIVDEVHCLELDRWKEWKTLATVQCLLDRTDEHNGRPCDEETDEAATELAHCEDIQRTENVEHITITYHKVLETPPACVAFPWTEDKKITTDGVFPGRCVPLPPHIPCQAKWQEQEYSGLWTPPQAPFQWEPRNSHCNQWSDCQEDCVIPAEPIVCAYSFYSGMLSNFALPNKEDECHEATREYLELPDGSYDLPDHIEDALKPGWQGLPTH